MSDSVSVMQTEKLYYDHTSAAPFGAEILELRPAGDKIQVILDRTIFYPEGGGQPADRGTINGVSLLDVQEKDGEILHLISLPAAGEVTARQLKPGPAELILDSRRRRDFTSLHSGQHLFSGIIFRMMGSQTVSMHLGDETCTIDVDASRLSDEILIDVEEAVADAIEENHPVIIHSCPPEDVSSFPLRKAPPKGEELIRVVEIEGNDFSPCCGTHVKSTAEIGMFRILGAESYKGITRVSFLAGRRLLRDSRLLRQNAAIVSHGLSVPLGEIGKGFLNHLMKTAQIENRLKTLEKEAARVKAQALLGKVAAAIPSDAGSPVIIVESCPDAGMDEVLNISRAAQKEPGKEGGVFILASERDLKFAAFHTIEGFDLRPLVKEAVEAQGGRGGGSPSFFQGSFGTKEALSAFLLAFKK